MEKSVKNCRDEFDCSVCESAEIEMDKHDSDLFHIYCKKYKKQFSRYYPGGI